MTNTPGTPSGSHKRTIALFHAFCRMHGYEPSRLRELLYILIHDHTLREIALMVGVALNSVVWTMRQLGVENPRRGRRA